MILEEVIDLKIFISKGSNGQAHFFNLDHPFKSNSFRGVDQIDS